MLLNKKTKAISCINAENAVLLRCLSECDSGSVGRALASQAEGRGFESRLSLLIENQGVMGGGRPPFLWGFGRHFCVIMCGMLAFPIIIQLLFIGYFTLYQK